MEHQNNTSYDTNSRHESEPPLSKSANLSREERMASSSIGSLIVSMAFPAIPAHLINILYSIIDRLCRLQQYLRFYFRNGMPPSSLTIRPLLPWWEKPCQYSCSVCQSSDCKTEYNRHTAALFRSHGRILFRACFGYALSSHCHYTVCM